MRDIPVAGCISLYLLLEPVTTAADQSSIPIYLTQTPVRPYFCANDALAMSEVVLRRFAAVCPGASFGIYELGLVS